MPSTSSPSFDDALSQRIDILRFALVVGLMMLHYGAYPESALSPFSGLQPSPYPLAVFVNAFVLFFFLCAVPALSAISGWLFFRNAASSVRFFARRLGARTRSIFVPMACWNAAVLAAFLIPFTVAGDPRLSAMAAYQLGDIDALDVANAVVGVTRRPIAFQLWFLHDLMLTVVVAPLLWVALRFAPLLGGAALFAVWLFDVNLPLFFRTDVLFFFYIGAFAQVRGLPVGTPAPRLGLTLLAIFACLAAARTLGPYFIAEQSVAGALLFDYGTRLMRIVGATAVWLTSSLLVGTGTGKVLARYGPVAFFLYAAHWPLNQAFKYGLDQLLPARTDLTLLLNYGLTAALTLGTVVAAAHVLNALCPPLFDLLSGGRSRIWLRRLAGDRGREPAEVRPPSWP